MKRLFLMLTLFGLCVAGCSRASDTASTNGNRASTATSPSTATLPSAAASPSSTSAPASQTNRPANANTGDAPKNDANNDVTGAYEPTAKLTGEFSEIDFMGLATIDDRGNPAPLNGFLRPKKKSAKDYHLVEPKLNGNDLTFSTESIAGVSYSFAGAFVKRGNFPENPPAWDEVVLKGTLTKMSGGKAIAETKVSFTYSAGG